MLLFRPLLCRRSWFSNEGLDRRLSRSASSKGEVSFLIPVLLGLFHSLGECLPWATVASQRPCQGTHPNTLLPERDHGEIEGMGHQHVSLDHVHVVHGRCILPPHFKYLRASFRV